MSGQQGAVSVGIPENDARKWRPTNFECQITPQWAAGRDVVSFKVGVTFSSDDGKGAKNQVGWQYSADVRSGNTLILNALPTRGAMSVGGAVWVLLVKPTPRNPEFEIRPPHALKP